MSMYKESQLVTEETVKLIDATLETLKKKNCDGWADDLEYFVEVEVDYYNSKSSVDYDFNKLIPELNKNIAGKCKFELERA